ncbi:MAG TPA: hypothetical protein VMY37_04460 [Thermoguttaceae bacterium]|nr:hypothetical protein [Thermoguttaceae bacterium]
MITLGLSDDRSRLLLRSPYSPAIVEFCHGLPNARWNRAGRTWTCDFTPATAWRLCRYLNGDGARQIDPAIVAACESFDLGTYQAAAVAGADSEDLVTVADFAQPEVRRTDGWWEV